MLISRTPFRVSFFGGGSDLPAYYQKEKGAVLNTTIDKYMYISIHPFFNRKQIRLKYSKTELVDDVQHIEHPLIRESLKFLEIKGGIEITSNADVPAGTGLGSSSSFTVGLINSIHAFKGKFVSKEDLAQMACDIELVKMKDPIGKQDQYAAAHGGMNLIEFNKDEKVGVSPLNLKASLIKELEENLLMFYTKTTRKTTEILNDQTKQLKSDKIMETQKKMVDLAYEGRDLLYNNDLTSFGQLLDKNWSLKKNLSKMISNNSIDKYYEKAIENGALGGKLLGAGSGGFLLFYCEPDKRDKVRSSLKDLFELEFKFDWQGSKILYVGEKDWGDNHGFFE